jgi:hypothetical protein
LAIDELDIGLLDSVGANPILDLGNFPAVRSRGTSRDGSLVISCYTEAVLPASTVSRRVTCATTGLEVFHRDSGSKPGEEQAGHESLEREQRLHNEFKSSERQVAEGL